MPIVPRDRFPEFWGWAQYNLGSALELKVRRSGGAEGLDLLARALAAYEAAHDVCSRAEKPDDWQVLQLRVGGVLAMLGERTEGPAGLELLARTVEAYEVALEVDFRGDLLRGGWATVQSNLGFALRAQGERSGGAAGLDLLARAVAAFDAALEVRTRADMPADWAHTQFNIALAQEARGDLSEGAAQAAHWCSAETAVLLALEVYDPEAMAFYHEMATEALARIRAKLAGGG